MPSQSLVAVIISAFALAIAGLTLWLTHFRRGNVIMTRPTVIYFGPDGSRTGGLNGRPKIFLRALLISDSKRGRIIQSLWVTLAHKEARQNFNIWVYGDDRLVRGSGLHINDTGLATNHHFLLPESETGFQFRDGEYRLEVFAEILGDARSKMLLSQTLRVSSAEAAELATGKSGLYFDWGPQANVYHSHIDRKPEVPAKALRDALLMLVEHGENSETVPENPD
jgi:hypothetical protein